MSSFKVINTITSPYDDNIRWLRKDFDTTYHWLVDSIYVICGLVVLLAIIYFAISYFYYEYSEYKQRKSKRG